MKTIKNILVSVTALIFTAGLALNFIGCNNNSPLNSDKERLSVQGEFQFIVFSTGNPALKKMIKVSQLVTKEEGGELILEYRGEEHNNGNVEVKITLKVFPETISQDTELALSLDDQVLLGNVDVVFGPHGITFNKPALLNIEAENLDMSGLDPKMIDIYYDNTEAGKWEKMKSKAVIVKPEEGYIKIIDAEIPHFSRYAVAWSR